MNFESGYLRKKWSVGLKILPLLGGIIALKLLLHFLEWEVLSLNPLFTSIVAATTFLLGFLITGVLRTTSKVKRFTAIWQHPCCL